MIMKPMHLQRKTKLMNQNPEGERAPHNYSGHLPTRFCFLLIFACSISESPVLNQIVTNKGNFWMRSLLF
jgi:hypothetical protein